MLSYSEAVCLLLYWERNKNNILLARNFFNDSMFDVCHLVNHDAATPVIELKLDIRIILIWQL
jgi:hypothetical protein